MSPDAAARVGPRLKAIGERPHDLEISEQSIDTWRQQDRADRGLIAGLTSGQSAERTLMTTKPFIYVFNVDPDEIANQVFTDELLALVAPAEAVFLDAKTEAELIELPDDEAELAGAQRAVELLKCPPVT